MAGVVSQACERCWRRKQKCSREIPTCLQCRTASANCIQRRFGSTAEVSDTGNDNGIGALQRRIQSLRLQLHQRAQQDFPSPATTSCATESVDRVVQDDVAYLSLSAMAERTDRQLFSTGALSFLTLLGEATGISGANPTLPIGDNASLSGTLAEFRQNSSLRIDLAGSDMRDAFDRYVNTVRVMFPFMTSKELLQQYESAVHHSGEQNPPEIMVLAFLGTATGILLGTHYTYKEMYATELAVRAIRLMPHVLDSARQLSAVRCLTALTIYSLYTPFGGSIWHLLGLTLTRCVSAGMHTTRLSDLHSDSEEKRQSGRTLWTLFFLDTIVSATMDRPFGLSSDDIVVSMPSSPSSGDPVSHGDDSMFRHLSQYAQMLRSIRSSKDPGAGILCHFINIRHWVETLPVHEPRSNSDHIGLSARAYMELLKQPSFLTDPDRMDVLDQAFKDFSTFIDFTEDRLVSNYGAVLSLDALLVFNIGIIIAAEASATLDGSKTATELFKIFNILTLLSSRYSAIRSLRDIIAELQQCISQGQSRDRLRILVESSEVDISHPIQNLMFGESSIHASCTRHVLG